MKHLRVRKFTTYCDPIAGGPCCEELTDPQAWHNSRGRQIIHQKFVRSRAILCLYNIPLWTMKSKKKEGKKRRLLQQDVHLRWYKFWDLPAMNLPPSVTKEPGQYLLRLKREKDSESPITPLNK